MLTLADFQVYIKVQASGVDAQATLVMSRVLLAEMADVHHEGIKFLEVGEVSSACVVLGDVAL